MDLELDKLSQREEEILRLAAEGMTDKEIAAHIGVKLSTVRTYWDRLKVKLLSANRTEAVARSLRLLPQALAPLAAFEILAEALPHMLAVADANGKVVFANSKCLNYFGLHGRDEVDWADLVHPEDLSALREPGADGRCEIRLRRRDGAYRWHLATHSPFDHWNGGGKSITTAVDVHELRRPND